jgi:hypothetical protein
MGDSCAINTLNKLSYLSGINEASSQYTNGSILIVADKRITIIYAPDCNPNNYFVYDASCNKRYFIPPSILTETLEKYSDCATIQAVSTEQLNSIERSYNLIAPPLLFCELNRNQKCATNQQATTCGPHAPRPSGTYPSSCGSCSNNSCATCCQTTATDGWGPAFVQDDCDPCNTGCNLLSRCGRTVFRHQTNSTSCIRCCSGAVKQLSYGTCSNLTLPRCSSTNPCATCGCNGCGPKVCYYNNTTCGVGSGSCAVTNTETGETTCIGPVGPPGPPGPQGSAFTPDIITSQNLFELSQVELAELGDGYSWLYTLDQKMYFLVEQDNGVFVWTEGARIVGPQGEPGPIGPAGVNGVQGPPGLPGAQGPVGAAFKPDEVASRDPSSFTQIELQNRGEGYAYLWTQTGMLYFIVGTGYPVVFSWTPGFPIIGQTGATGAAGATGAPGTAGATGSQGAAFDVDLYLDTNPYDLNSNDLEAYYTAGIRSILWTLNGNLFFIRIVDDVYTLSCPLGLVGPQGLQGMTGPTGAMGPIGEQGPRGTQGVTGPTGPTGMTGPRGDVGAAYQPNLVNSRDINTFTQYELQNFGEGFAYLWTDDGSLYFVVQNSSSSLYEWSAGFPIVGQTGSQGATGSLGPTGAQGIQGPTGYAGTDGAQGDTGPTGAQGVTGERGPTGARGIQGPAYTPDLITDREPTDFTQRDLQCLGVTTSVLFTGTGDLRFIECDSTSGLLYFGPSFPIVGVAGDPGSTGPTGAEGATGPQGDPGPAGGPTGPTGTSGVTGPTGPAGPPGGGGGDSLWFEFSAPVDAVGYAGGSLFVGSNVYQSDFISSNLSFYIAPNENLQQFVGTFGRIENKNGLPVSMEQMVTNGSTTSAWKWKVPAAGSGETGRYDLIYNEDSDDLRYMSFNAAISGDYSDISFFAPVIHQNATITHSAPGSSLVISANGTSSTIDVSGTSLAINQNHVGTEFEVFSTESTFRNITCQDLTSVSDLRKKRVTRPMFGDKPQIPGWREKLISLQRIYFQYNDDPSQKERVGLIAQELIQKGFHDLVHTDKHGTYSVAYDKLSLYLIEAMREMNVEMTDMKKKLNFLMSKFDDYEE